MPIFRRKSQPAAEPSAAGRVDPGQPRPGSADEGRFLVSGGFAGVRPLLRPKLFRDRLLPADLNPVARQLGAGLTAALALPGPSGIGLVRQSHLREWRVDSEEAWAIAMHNLRREPLNQIAGPPAEPWTVFHGPASSATATHLLRLEELLAEPAPQGAFVVVPEDDLLVFTPIRGADCVLHLEPLRDFASSLAGKDPNSHVRWTDFQHVLWWTQGTGGSPRLEGVGLTQESPGASAEEKWTITGSQRFVDMMTVFMRQLPKSTERRGRR